MNLMMIGGDRAVLRKKQGPYWRTLQFLRQHWHRIDVIVPLAPTKGSKQIEFDEPGGEVWFHPNPQGLWHQLKWIEQTGKQLLHDRDYDLITAHLFPPFYATIGAARLHRGNTPLVMELHGLAGLPAASGLTDQIGAWLSRWYLPRALPAADAVRVVNPYLQETLQNWGGDPEKIKLVPAIYLDTDLYKETEASERPVDVVFCGRLDWNKGVLTLLKTLAQLPGATATIIGDGPLMNQCRRFIGENELSDRVRLTGYISDHQEVIREISRAKCLVMISKYEGGPRVVFEAMACGTVPISTPVGLAATVIEDGQNGRLTTGEPDDLATIVTEVCRDDHKRTAMQQAGLAVRKCFDRNTTLQDYQDFLYNVAKTRL